MKAKVIFLVVSVVCVSGGIAWFAGHKLYVRHELSMAKPPAPDGRKVLFYTCSMHPWVKEDKPGRCPVCGMDLTPVYEGEATNFPGEVTLEPDSISVIHVQTSVVESRPVRHTLHLAGEITGNSTNAAWFAFTVYERD